MHDDYRTLRDQQARLGHSLGGIKSQFAYQKKTVEVRQAAMNAKIDAIALYILTFSAFLIASALYQDL